MQVDVQLEPPARVSLMPSLDDIQECINKSAQAILGCFKQVKFPSLWACVGWTTREDRGTFGVAEPQQH